MCWFHGDKSSSFQRDIFQPKQKSDRIICKTHCWYYNERYYNISDGNKVCRNMPSRPPLSFGKVCFTKSIWTAKTKIRLNLLYLPSHDGGAVSQFLLILLCRNVLVLRFTCTWMQFDSSSICGNAHFKFGTSNPGFKEMGWKKLCLQTDSTVHVYIMHGQTVD